MRRFASSAEPKSATSFRCQRTGFWRRWRMPSVRSMSSSGSSAAEAWGRFYLGRDRALDRLVAIKVLPPESTDAESTERFRREARTAANLTHPNIVPV